MDVNEAAGDRIFSPAGRRLTRSMRDNENDKQLVGPGSFRRKTRNAPSKGQEKKTVTTYTRKKTTKAVGKGKKKKKMEATNDDDDFVIPEFEFEDKPLYLGVALQWGNGPVFADENPNMMSPFDRPELSRQHPDTATAMALRSVMIENKEAEGFKRYTSTFFTNYLVILTFLEAL